MSRSGGSLLLHGLKIYLESKIDLSPYIKYNKGDMQTKEEKLLKHRESQRKYKASIAGKKTENRYRKSKYYQAYRIRHANKLKEHRVVWKLVDTAKRSGTLLKKRCEVCNKKDAIAHHDDYNKPLEIRWLCRYHHYLYHKKLKELR